MSEAEMIGRTVRHLAVCIPACNEAARLPVLLDALAAQTWSETIPVSLALNNCDDDSLSVAQAVARRHADRLAISISNDSFEAPLAHAGSARKLAMDRGLRLLPSLEHSILVSTDADTRPPPEWLASIANAFDRGASLVGGRIDLDTDEPLPDAAMRLRAAWDDYWSQVRAIEDEIDPLPWDPAPRHGDHTGASLAIDAALDLACGGVPVVPTGEDRALVTAAQSLGGRLAHPATVWTRVSPRVDGRASGGMAAHMRDLLAAATGGEQPMVPGFDQWRARANWRRDLRRQSEGRASTALHEEALPPMSNDMKLPMALEVAA